MFDIKLSLFVGDNDITMCKSFEADTDDTYLGCIKKRAIGHINSDHMTQYQVTTRISRVLNLDLNFHIAKLNNLTLNTHYDTH